MRNKRGITLIGFVFFAICICVIGLLTMRILPVYIKHYYVLHAAKALRSLPKADLQQEPVVVARLLRVKIMNQLYLNEIRHLKSKQIKITLKRKYYLITIKYQVTQPLVANITLLFDFDSRVEVPIAG